jgi:hypothetical protein
MPPTHRAPLYFVVKDRNKIKKCSAEKEKQDMGLPSKGEKQEKTLQDMGWFQFSVNCRTRFLGNAVNRRLLRHWCISLRFQYPVRWFMAECSHLHKMFLRLCPMELCPLFVSLVTYWNNTVICIDDCVKYAHVSEIWKLQKISRKWVVSCRRWQRTWQTTLLWLITCRYPC